MVYFLTMTTSVASAMLVFMLQSAVKENAKLKREKEEKLSQRDDAIVNGVRQLLSVRLEEIYDQYANSTTISRRAYDRWMKHHAAYKGLNGNGTFDHMKTELQEKHIAN